MVPGRVVLICAGARSFFFFCFFPQQSSDPRSSENNKTDFPCLCGEELLDLGLKQLLGTHAV